MIILKIILIIFTILFTIKVLESFGNYLSKKLALNLNFGSKVILGYSILNIYLYFSYFFLKLENKYIFISIIIAIFFLLIKNLELNKNKIIYFFILLISIIYLIPVILFEEQFYVFRGNYWDFFNYISSATLFKNYSYNEILNYNFDKIYLSFQNIDKIVQYRPLTNYVISLFLNIKYLDIFLIVYLYKVFTVCLIFISFKEIVNKQILDYKEKYILSFVFVISFWTIFIFEIDALSHLASIPILLVCISKMDLFFNSLLENKKNFLIFFIINTSALFLIYPEIIFVLGLIIFIYFIKKIQQVKIKKNFFENIFFSFFIFLILIVQSYNTNIEFVFLQINQAFDSSIDWWGYYGAFILGRDNLVTNNDFVQSIKMNLNNNFLDILKTIYYSHYEQNYKFIYLNFLPSLFGLYHLTVTKVINNFDYIELFFVILINIYLLNIIRKNIFILNNIKLYLISFFILFLLLILNKNFWTIIKIYSYIFPFIFLFFSISFKEKKINKLYLLMLISFIFYKYSIFNFGIGKFDSFPSIINKDFKTNISWSLDQKKLKNCNQIQINVKEYFKKAYIILKLTHQKIEIINQDTKNSKKFNCKINFKNKEFKIEY